VRYRVSMYRGKIKWAIKLRLSKGDLHVTSTEVRKVKREQSFFNLFSHDTSTFDASIICLCSLTIHTQERVRLMYLQAHHLKVVERLTALFQDDPRYLALLVGGSLVKGWVSVNSDVDVMLVVTENEKGLGQGGR
jgi:hypothetical protein